MRSDSCIDLLSEQQCALIERALTENVEPRKAAAYLCLHMGLMLSEVAALQWNDVDVEREAVTLRSCVSASLSLKPFDPPRILPMPEHVVHFFRLHTDMYDGGDCFVLTGERTLPAFHHMQNILTTVALKAKLGCTLSASDLRNAFIRRCIQSGMDLFSICTYIGIKQPNVIVKRFFPYFTPKLDMVKSLEKYGTFHSADESAETCSGPKRMNLLILGAGSQGPVVREIAEAIGIFEEIAFLDDNPNNPLAIGPLRDIGKLASRYPMAIASFGDSFLRRKYLDELEALGYIVPTLIHPTATISPDAKIGRSVVVEARCIVSSSAELGRGALISGASVIEVGAKIGKFSHIGSSVTVSKLASVADYARIPSGTIIRAK